MDRVRKDATPPMAPEPVYHDEPAPGSFIPPQPERAVRPARMPRIDELPLPRPRR